jgi:16S rRNA (adenine1518-N6/adenine1519-N6)-dimethyltransferase
VKPIHVKRFGQHFLHDFQYIKRILEEAAIQPMDSFVEIGPGGGALTAYLLPMVRQLIAIEIDSELCIYLQTKFSSWGERFCLYQADALQFDFSNIPISNGEKMRFIGNLPYNIATPLLFHCLKYRHFIKDFHFMLQKEVADRLVATPGSKAYSRLTVMMRYYAKVERLFVVRSGAFIPPPKVESAIVRITPLERPSFHANDEMLFANLVKQAFNQRRKTIANSLHSLGIERAQLLECHINPQVRAEQLEVEDYVRLANEIELSK